MGIWRQIYPDDSGDRLLEAESAATGLSVSELIRRAIRQSYGSGRRLTWDEVFAHRVVAGSADREFWSFDRLFDDELLDEAIPPGRLSNPLGQAS